jgi:uncharacterized protein YeeX (DUF496 family)
MPEKKHRITELLRLYEIQNRLSHELSALNIKCIDAGKRVELIDKEIGSGHRRVDELVAAKDEYKAVEKSRNEVNTKYFEALEEFEEFRRDSMSELFAAAISEYEILEPLHRELMAKISRWRSYMEFLGKYYIPRAIKKEHGFIILNGGQESTGNILESEDERAVVLLQRIIQGEVKNSEPKRGKYSAVKPRKRGTLYG